MLNRPIGNKNMATPAPKPLRVLAIDPGYERLGIAVAERASEGPTRGKDVLLFSECFQTSAKLSFPSRLRSLGEEIARVIEEFEPTVLAIETLFFTNNQKTAMNVSEARGVIVYEAARHELPIAEYGPGQIKNATTGYGKSDKQQVTNMLPKLIKISKEIEHDDEYDAIACAITCLASYRP